jgi:hypothetical protein
LADQLARLRKEKQSEAERAFKVRALAIGGRVEQWFKTKATELSEVFKGKGLQRLRLRHSAEMDQASDKSRWFRRQVIDSAHVAGHYADFRVFSGWASLRLKVDDFEVRYVASIHGAGFDSAVVAVTTFGVLGSVKTSDEESIGSAPEDIRNTKDAFRVVRTELVEDIEKRSAELEDLLDEGLAVALAAFLSRL